MRARKCTILIFLTILFAAGDARARTSVENTKSVGEKPASPTAKQALKAVLANGDILLASIPSCKSMGTTSGDKTILDFLSGVIAFQTEPKSQNSLEYNVKLIRGKNRWYYWECELLFSSRSEAVGDGDIAISGNGVKFFMRTGNEKMIRSSLTCTGTG